MFRRQLLPRACLTIALSAAVLAGAASAWGQAVTTEERLDRLERDLNMLQRQVYPGGPPPAGAPGSGAVDLEVRMERLEQQMRDLTGRVEEIGNRVDQLRQRVEPTNGGVDMRLGLGPGGNAAAGPPGPAPTPPPGQPDQPGAPPFPAAAAPFGAVTPPAPAAPPPPAGSASGGPTPIFGTLTPPGTPPETQPGTQPEAAPPPPATRPHQAVATAAPPAKPEVAAGPSAGSPTEQYNRAFTLVRKADYSAAEAALLAFIERHPKDKLAGSAQYWLGETYYARGRYLEAASAFAEGYKRWPNSAKAPDGLLKLGMALARANENQNACLAFTELNHAFPHPGTAIKERAIAERRRLGC
jgi:tol-pal system protein YbgF